MIKIKKSVLKYLEQEILSGSIEKGFILGCTSTLEQIDHCCEIPAIKAGIYYYMPDSKDADSIIHKWMRQNICFCGFIHSHIVDKEDLSENDMEFAQNLFAAYEIPVMWFGLGIVKKEKVKFRFYSIEREDTFYTKVSSVDFESV